MTGNVAKTSHVTVAAHGHDAAAHLRATLQFVPFAVFITNGSGRFVFANAFAQKLSGYSEAELLGTLPGMLIPAWREGLRQVRPDGARLAVPASAMAGTQHYAVRHKDGTQFPAEITLNPMHPDDTAGMMFVVVDQSEHYELQRNRQQLAHLTRVSALGELAASLAHELNQPLTAILSNAQAAQRFMSSQPIDLAEVREILRDLVEDNQRASAVIRKIRALVRKDELESVSLKIATVIDDVALLVRSDAIVRGIRVVLDVQPGLPAVQGDGVQLQQVVLNLFLNAFDAVESGAASVRAVRVDVRRDGADTIRVAVCDNGPGLADGVFEKLFVPFYTSKREGLGLGLSISRSIIAMHGGRIWAENNRDQGATFQFTLPVAPTATLSQTWATS